MLRIGGVDAGSLLKGAGPIGAAAHLEMLLRRHAGTIWSPYRSKGPPLGECELTCVSELPFVSLASPPSQRSFLRSQRVEILKRFSGGLIR